MSSQIVCLWLIDSNVNFLGSWEENQTFNKLFTGRANELIKKQILKGESTHISSQQSLSENNDKNNLQAVFLLDLFVYIQLVFITCTRLSRIKIRGWNYRFPSFARFVEDKWTWEIFEKMLHFWWNWHLSEKVSWSDNILGCKNYLETVFELLFWLRNKRWLNFRNLIPCFKPTSDLLLYCETYLND